MATRAQKDGTWYQMKRRHAAELDALLLETLAKHKQQRKATAAELGITRITLYNRLKALGFN